MKKITTILFSTCFLLSCNQVHHELEESKNFQYLTKVKLPELNQNHLELEESFIQSNLNVYEKVMAELIKKEENIVYSPTSLYYALSMLANASKTDTFLNYLDLTNLSLLNENIQKHFQNSFYDLDLAKLKLANSMWINQNREGKVNAQFIHVLEKYFYADMFSCDFQDNKTMQNIAKWVNLQTDDFLNKKEEDFATYQSQETAMLLFNTIYFNSSWNHHAYELQNLLSFYGTKQTTPVRFMKKNIQNCYLQNEKGVFFSDSFYHGKAYIHYYMPNVYSNEDTVISDLLHYLNCQKKTGGITFQMPKIDITYRFDCKEILSSLGIQDWNMAHVYEGLFVDTFTQETRLKLSEKGVEAAAITSISAADCMPTEDIVLELNRPFFYLLCDSDNIPLFSGQVVNF